MMACKPEAHKRLTVFPATVTGKPASNAAILATFLLSSPAWLAAPIYTSSTIAASIPVRATIARITNAARSSGRTEDNTPPYRPIGVRNAQMTAAFLCMVRSYAMGPRPTDVHKQCGWDLRLFRSDAAQSGGVPRRRAGRMFGPPAPAFPLPLVGELRDVSHDGAHPLPSPLGKRPHSVQPRPGSQIQRPAVGVAPGTVGGQLGAGDRA